MNNYAKGCENFIPGNQVLVDVYHPMVPDASATLGKKGTKKK
jgi:hypothetical protein